MVKTVCDRCGREQDTTGEKYKFDFFIKVLNYDLCPECNILLNEFIHNKKTNKQTEVKPNEQEKASNT